MYTSQQKFCIMSQWVRWTESSKYLLLRICILKLLLFRHICVGNYIMSIMSSILRQQPKKIIYPEHFGEENHSSSKKILSKSICYFLFTSPHVFAPDPKSPESILAEVNGIFGRASWKAWLFGTLMILRIWIISGKISGSRRSHPSQPL